MTLSFSREWIEFLSSLNSHHVKFLLVGGHAVAAHGQPRFTEDLDLFVLPNLENARRLRAAIVDFGFGANAPPAEDLAEPNKVLMLGRKPHRIDVLTGISGVTFDQARVGRLSTVIGGQPVEVIGLQSSCDSRVDGAKRDPIART